MIKTINVTQRDCEHGFRGQCGECPVARAVNRVATKLGLAANVMTFSVQFYKRTSDGWYRRKSVELDSLIGETIARYDKGMPMRPFSFKLEIPEFPQ